MKLTVAMGLQYDNGKSTNLYALTLGQEGKKPISAPNNPVVHVAQVSNRLPAFAPVRKDIVLILTYTLRGFPAPAIQESANINLFA